MHLSPVAALLLLPALGSPQVGHAAPMPAKLLADYGGEYSAACADPKALRARIDKDGLSLVRGERKVTGTFEMEALTYLGQSPPEGYETALMGHAKGLGSIVFVIYRGKSGPLVDLDTDAPVLKKVGVSKRGTVKYRRC